MHSLRLAAGMLLLFFATRAQAAIDCNSVTGEGASSYTAEENGETLTFGAVLNRTPDVAIDQIQFSLCPTTGMDVTHYILETELGGASGSVTWLPDGDGTILIRQTTKKQTNAAAGQTDYFLLTEPPTSTSQSNRSQNNGILGSAGSPAGSWGPENGGGSVNIVPSGLGAIHSATNPLGPGGDGNAAFAPHIPLATLDVGSLPKQSFSFMNESGGEGEFGGLSIPQSTLNSVHLPENSLAMYGPGVGAFDAPISQAALDTEHLPEPSTLTMFGLASLGIAIGYLRRAFRKAA